jgi:hypothetical protein
MMTFKYYMSKLLSLTVWVPHSCSSGNWLRSVQYSDTCMQLGYILLNRHAVHLGLTLAKRISAGSPRALRPSTGSFQVHNRPSAEAIRRFLMIRTGSGHPPQLCEAGVPCRAVVGSHRGMSGGTVAIPTLPSPQPVCSMKPANDTFTARASSSPTDVLSTCHRVS